MSLGCISGFELDLDLDLDFMGHVIMDGRRCRGRHLLIGGAMWQGHVMRHVMWEFDKRSDLQTVEL